MSQEPFIPYSPTCICAVTKTVQCGWTNFCTCAPDVGLNNAFPPEKIIKGAPCKTKHQGHTIASRTEQKLVRQGFRPGTTWFREAVKNHREDADDEKRKKDRSLLF